MIVFRQVLKTYLWWFYKLCTCHIICRIL